ncbi:CaiB/BaiF CoA transferase family protein [Pseudonocardia sulfidoxydans]|uniref:CaiB/BaiF CoA transferase family protein n=1 Tax=Pseudonocardia sulfidoxydans TaxID=54011 RepID=UPI0036172F77
MSTGRTRPAGPTLPLSGVRVLDFTWVISGPQCTQVLADFGAEVIRVEWPHHPDGLRYRVQPPGADPTSPEQSGLWNNLNRNKRSITLNMRHPDAMPLALSLIEKSDVVVENFSPGVLASWGLSWDVMRSVNPRLVYLSMTGFGSSGPDAGHVVFAPIMQAVSGLHAMTGRPGAEPAGLGYSYGDHVAGYFGALAVLAALRERDVTGSGTSIDLSQVEASIALTSTALLDHQVGDRSFVPWGNVSYGSHDAPAGLYRCAGTRSWCAISVQDDAQWARLAQGCGFSDLAADPRLASPTGRAAHRGLLDSRLTEWTRARERDDVIGLLDGWGIPVSPLASVDEVMNSGPLRKRGYFESATHEALGTREFQMGAISSEHGPRLRTAAPVMGEANHDVFAGILGLSGDAVRAYRDDQVI